MNTNVLSKYMGLFGSLHRNINKTRGAAPHKPVLLLAVLDEIERGNIRENFIELTPELVAAFRAYWRALVPPDFWQERIFLPFRYLVQEGFWTLVKNGMPQPTQTLGSPSSIGQLNAVADGAVLADDLWKLLQDKVAVDALRTCLLQEYFGVKLAEVQPQIPVNPIDYEVEKLKAEAQARFRARRVSEASDETGYYVRHALFPRVVKQLYNDSCAVCALSVYTENSGGLVDAAHIMPFGLFHNDDPRNGIAFCKNHHWGFDAGWYTISDEYRIVVSPQLRHALPYVTDGVLLHLPDNPQHYPAPDALNWHRKNVYLK